MNWIKTGKTLNADGGSVITYEPDPAAKYISVRIESWKRPIEHSNGIGTWMYTSYFVIRDGVDVAEKHSLADAKAFAEELIGKDTRKWRL